MPPFLQKWGVWLTAALVLPLYPLYTVAQPLAAWLWTSTSHPAKALVCRAAGAAAASPWVATTAWLSAWAAVAGTLVWYATCGIRQNEGRHYGELRREWEGIRPPVSSAATQPEPTELRAPAYWDPVLAMFPPRDRSQPIFRNLWASGALALAASFIHGHTLPWALTHAAVALVRCVMMFAFPLDPPATMRLLRDPMVEWCTGTREDPLVFDLFFSGHTAFLVVNALFAAQAHEALLAAQAYLFFRGTWYLLEQHCHYSIDILTAPFVAGALYALVSGTTRALGACALGP